MLLSYRKNISQASTPTETAICVNITDSKLEHKNSLRQQLKATKPADPVKKQQTSKQQER